MKSLIVNGSLRETLGKKGAKASRNEGQVPCVLYGGTEQIHFIADEANFRKLIYTPDAYLVKLNINNKEYSAILKEVQFHPVTDKPLHIDFIEVMPEKPIEIEIPIHYEGTAMGVALKGGVLAKSLRKILVKGLIENIPEVINIDISKLDLNHSIKIGDLKQDNLLFAGATNSVIVAVRTARTVEVVTAAGPAEGAEGTAATTSAATAETKPGEAKPEAKKEAKKEVKK